MTFATNYNTIIYWARVLKNANLFLTQCASVLQF